MKKTYHLQIGIYIPTLKKAIGPGLVTITDTAIDEHIQKAIKDNPMVSSTIDAKEEVDIVNVKVSNVRPVKKNKKIKAKSKETPAPAKKVEEVEEDTNKLNGFLP